MKKENINPNYSIGANATLADTAIWSAKIRLAKKDHKLKIIGYHLETITINMN